MKTIKKNDDLKRVSNEKALDLVNMSGYHYVPKNVWKRRNDNKAKIVVDNQEVI